MKKRVSVIVPIYKTDIELLKTCLNSLNRQSYDSLEILLVDDNYSKDMSGPFIDAYKFENASVKIFHQKNAGVSAARNKGIENSSGEYIMFVDSDDILHEDAISMMVNTLETSSSELILSSCNVLKNSETQINHFYPDVTIDDKIKDLVLQTLSKGFSTYYPPVIGVGVPWAKLFKSEIIKSYNIKFDTTMNKYEDLNFLIEYLNYTSKIENIRKPLYSYRLHDNTLSHGFNSNIFDVTKSAMKVLKLTISNSNFSDLEESLEIKTLNEINSLMKQNIVNKQNTKSIIQRRRDLSKILLDPYFSDSRKLNMSKMTVKERLIYFLIKNRLSYVLIILFKIEDKL